MDVIVRNNKGTGIVFKSLVGLSDYEFVGTQLRSSNPRKIFELRKNDSILYPSERKYAALKDLYELEVLSTGVRDEKTDDLIRKVDSALDK